MSRFSNDPEQLSFPFAKDYLKQKFNPNTGTVRVTEKYTDEGIWRRLGNEEWTFIPHFNGRIPFVTLKDPK